MDLLKPRNPHHVMLRMCLQMWSHLCGMKVMMYVLLKWWLTIYVNTIEYTGTTSSMSLNAQVLRVIALILSPMWVIHYTTMHFPPTSPHSNSQYNMSSMLVSHHSPIILIVPTIIYIFSTIIYIDKWGRRPMPLFCTLLMGFWMFLVGGIQGAFGKWSDASGTNVWIITGNMAAMRAVIVCSYLFVSR